MTRTRRISAVISMISTPFFVATASGATTTTADGGSMQTKLSAHIILNEESTLRREWVAVHDDTMPVDLIGTPGAITIYRSGDRYSSGGYEYKAFYAVRMTEPVVAIEVRFITFDVWGERTRALVATDIKDFMIGEHPLEAAWNLYSENEASEYYASIGYVAAVRTEAGKVYRADVGAITDAARKYMSDFTSDLLDENPSEGKGE